MSSIEEIKLWAWTNATIVEGYDPSNYKKDACGAWLIWEKYGIQESPFGWEIDHIYPKSKGGTTCPENVRAMQHQNNASKSDNYPFYKAVMTSEDDHNVSCNKIATVNIKKQEELSKLYNII